MATIERLDAKTNVQHHIVLVTGPARSGKSEWAEALAAQSKKSVIYIATSTIDPQDQDWQARIEQHRQRRPADWRLWEVPVDLGGGDRRRQRTRLSADRLPGYLAG
jgi:adenosyl cobinamide kinase/adenosyl cobinamide phosphate guanylyltransferase